METTIVSPLLVGARVTWPLKWLHVALEWVHVGSEMGPCDCRRIPQKCTPFQWRTFAVRQSDL